MWSVDIAKGQSLWLKRGMLCSDVSDVAGAGQAVGAPDPTALNPQGSTLYRGTRKDKLG